MKKQYIAVIDSGIGGLTTLFELQKNIKNVNFLYYGDNFNAPYGNRVSLDLENLLKNAIDKVLQYNVNCIVVACNTLSVSVLEKLRDYCPVAMFGIYPPVEIALLSNKTTLLLATVKTAEKFTSINNFTSLGLPNLAKDIENNIFNLEKVCIKDHLKPLGCKSGFNTLILGCTHYNFIKNEIINHLKPQLTICGNVYTVNKVKEYIKFKNRLEITNENNIVFIGENKKFNKIAYKIYSNRQ